LSSTATDKNSSVSNEDIDSNLHKYFFPYLLGYNSEKVDLFFLRKWQQSPAIFKNTGGGTAKENLYEMINKGYLDAILLHNDDLDDDENAKEQKDLFLTWNPELRAIKGSEKEEENDNETKENIASIIGDVADIKAEDDGEENTFDDFGIMYIEDLLEEDAIEERVGYSEEDDMFSDPLKEDHASGNWEWKVVKRITMKETGEEWSGTMPVRIGDGKLLAKSGLSAMKNQKRKGVFKKAYLDTAHKAFHKDGFSIIINSLDTKWMAMEKLATNFEDYFGHRTSINLYLTPPNAQAFEVHYDWMDTYILQIEGEKHWLLYDNTFKELPSPWMKEKIMSSQDENLKLIGNFTLKPGDMLYMPAGYPHQASTNSSNEPSLHITVGVETTFIGSYESLLRYFLYTLTYNINFEKITKLEGLESVNKIDESFVSLQNLKCEKMDPNQEFLPFSLFLQSPLFEKEDGVEDNAKSTKSEEESSINGECSSERHENLQTEEKRDYIGKDHLLWGEILMIFIELVAKNNINAPFRLAVPYSQNLKLNPYLAFEGLSRILREEFWLLSNKEGKDNSNYDILRGLFFDFLKDTGKSNTWDFFDNLIAVPPNLDTSKRAKQSHEETENNILKYLEEIDENERKTKTIAKLKLRFRDLIVQFTCLIENKENQKLILEYFERFMKRDLLAKQVLREKRLNRFKKNFEVNKF